VNHYHKFTDKLPSAFEILEEQLAAIPSENKNLTRALLQQAVELRRK
jgi:hypothetical protein